MAPLYLEARVPCGTDHPLQRLTIRFDSGPRFQLM